MRRQRRSVAYGAMMALWLVNVKPIWAEMQMQKPQMSMAEVIVKFTAGSEAQQVVTAAIKEGGQPNAAIVRLVQTLSAQLNVPLQAHRVTSGGELVWSVDTNAVAQQVASHLERRDDIQRALPITADTSKGPGYQNPNVLIEFTPDSKYARTLAKTLQESPTSLPVWQGFSRSVGNDLGLPLTIQPEQVPRLILAVHMESLLAELVERLRQRSDVEYAQPNFLLQPHMDR